MCRQVVCGLRSASCVHHVWRSCVTNQDTSANLGWARATRNGIALFGCASASRRLFVCELYNRKSVLVASFCSNVRGWWVAVGLATALCGAGFPFFHFPNLKHPVLSYLFHFCGFACIGRMGFAALNLNRVCK